MTDELTTLRARVAELERLVANFEAGGRVSFGDCSPEVRHRLARIAELEAALREIRSKSGDQWSIDAADRALGGGHG